jgi:hypothetical protein
MLRVFRRRPLAEEMNTSATRTEGAALVIGASSSMDAVNAERLIKNEYDLVLIATRLWHWRSAREMRPRGVQAAASARTASDRGGCPKARRKARRMRSRSANPFAER